MDEKIDVEITVNNKPLEVNRFVTRLTTNVVLGIVNALRVPDEEIEKVEIELTRRR